MVFDIIILFLAKVMQAIQGIEVKKGTLAARLLFIVSYQLILHYDHYFINSRKDSYNRNYSCVTACYKEIK